MSDLIFLAVGIYLMGGTLFALYFLTLGQKRFGESVTHAKWGFRVIIVPSLIGLWPFLIHPLFGSAESPLMTGTIRYLQIFSWLILLLVVHLAGITILSLRTVPLAPADEVQQIQSLITSH